MTPEPYDIDQTLVPDAFLALYLRHGRPTVDRAELQARHDLAETLASHIATRCPQLEPDDVGPQRKVLDKVLAGLVAEPAQVTLPEARWIIGRVAELLDYSGEAVTAVVTNPFA